LVKKLYGLALVIGILIFGRVFPGTEESFCLYLRIFGIPDGGCGSFRAVKSLSEFDVLTSLKYNPLVLPSLIFIGLYPFLNERFKLFGILLIVASFFIFTVVRAVFYFYGLDVPFITLPP